MKKIIIMVLSHEDAAALAAAGKVIGRLGCSDIWVLLSPVLAIDVKTAVKELDAQIAELDVAMDRAAALRDFKSADSYKAERERLQLNRSVEIRNAWKRVPEAERNAAVAKYMTPFLREASPNGPPDKKHWAASILAEHQEKENWVPILNELKGRWHIEMKPGEFAVMWPGQLLELEDKLLSKDGKKLEPTTEPSAPKVPVPPMNFNAEARRTQLNGFLPSKVIFTAKRLGIKTKMKETAALVDEIVAAETAKAVASL